MARSSELAGLWDHGHDLGAPDWPMATYPAGTLLVEVAKLDAVPKATRTPCSMSSWCNARLRCNVNSAHHG